MRFCSLIAALGIAVASVIVGAGGVHAASDAELRALRLGSDIPVRASSGDADGVIRTLRGRFSTTSGDRVAEARRFLARHARALGLRADGADLSLVRRSDDRGGETLVFEQRQGGVPVFGAEVLIGFDPEGRIVHVRNGSVQDLDVPTRPSIGADQAGRIATQALGIVQAAVGTSPQLVVVRGDKGHPGHRLAWRVDASTRDPSPGSWLVFVDARTGAVLRTIDRIKWAAPACTACNPLTDPACGSVFFQNPVVALDDVSLQDASNVDGAQTACSLENLVSGTQLDGLYATTAITSNRTGPPYDAARSVSQQSVDEVNAYFHVDRAKRYLDALGFPALMSFAIDIDAHDGAIGDASYYDPFIDALHFGEGGVDDAQDPEIVYHEYGHAIQEHQVPAFGFTLEGGAMGEGFGDYWGRALLDTDWATLLGPACVGSWDAVAYAPYDGSLGSGCLRRLDTTREFPRDLRSEVHDDGEMWSAALWALRSAVGGAVADMLVIKSHTYLTASAGFIDGADALLSADQSLHGGVHAQAIHDAMRGRGIPRTGTPASSTGLDLSVAFVCESTHDYQNLEYRECSFTQPGAERLRLHFSRFETEGGFDFLYVSNAELEQVEALSGLLFGGGGGYSAAVEGDTIVARFKADESVRSWGFRIDSVEYALAPPVVPVLSGWARAVMAGLLVVMASRLAWTRRAQGRPRPRPNVGV